MKNLIRTPNLTSKKRSLYRVNNLSSCPKNGKGLKRKKKVEKSKSFRARGKGGQLFGFNGDF